MKSTLNFAILLTMASLGQGLPQGSGGSWLEPIATLVNTPEVWLYWDDNGTEKYTSNDLNMQLDNKCHPSLAKWDGIWIDRDTRPIGSRQGCAYVYRDDDCYGRYDPIELKFSGSDHSEVDFKDTTLKYVGASFRFNNKPCEGGGTVLRPEDDMTLPTPKS